MSLTPIFELPAIAYAAGVRDAMISPGSRSAPIAVAFSRYPGITVRVAPDERAAGFMGLGISEATGRPVVLICTSGTALMNYGPAVAEAWYRNLPLCVFSADRPPELIDQADGQAIRQPGVFGRHVKMTAKLSVPGDESNEQIVAQVASALGAAVSGRPGPVHVNIPMREPLYPVDGAEYGMPAKCEYQIPREEIPTIVPDLPPLFGRSRMLIVIGQSAGSPALHKAVARVLDRGVMVVGDATSNLHDVPGVLRHHDRVLSAKLNEDCRPELVVTLGGPILSKRLKTFLRGCSGMDHWHVLPSGEAPDTFGFLNRTIHADEIEFLNDLAEIAPEQDPEHGAAWRSVEQQGAEGIVAEPTRFSFLAVVENILENLPGNVVLHAGNSMAVRYVDAIGVPAGRCITLRANRGTSGIDGCVSTAVGHAMADHDRLHVLLVGDMSYLYDSNALWCDTRPKNLRIIVLNDQGGGIFEMISGPASLEECDKLFVAEHDMSIRATTERSGAMHLIATSHEELKPALMNLFQEGPEIKVLEIPATRIENIRAWTQSRGDGKP